MPLKIIRNDITKVKADAIVNTANPNVAIGGGVDTAIYKAAGEERLLDERRKIGRLEPGEVAITPAFDLDAKYIIHASGSRWRDGDSGEKEILRQCYDKSLQIAADNDCDSIAFPLLATGSYGFPQRIGIEIAVEAFTRFLEEHEMDIILVVFGHRSVSISGELGREVLSYIDDSYVSNALAEEYHLESNLSEYVQVDEYEDSACSRRDTDSSKKSDRRRLLGSSLAMGPAARAAKTAARAESLDEVLKGIYTDSFEKHLQMLINKKGLKNSEVYAAANISKQTFSKIINGKAKPSKEKVLALAVGLRLNMDEAVDFLKIAGYALSPISQTDAVVGYFIAHEEYSVIKIDMVLFDYGLDPLSNG